MRKEIFGILLFFLVVLTLVSLLSYSPADPSLTHLVTASGRDIHNVFGLVGAYLSGSLVGLFGLGAFWIPPLMLLSAFWQLRNRSRKIMGLTVLGGLFLIISTGGLLSLFRSEYFFWNHPFSSGGIIGSPFSAFLAAYANRSGAILVLSLFFILGIILTTGISVVTLARVLRLILFRAGGGMVRTASGVLSWILSLFRRLNSSRKKRASIINLVPAGINVKQLPGLKKKSSASPDIFREEPVIKERPREVSSELKCENSGDIRENRGFLLPPISLLNQKKKMKGSINTDLLRKKGEILENKLKDFGIQGEVVEILPGPVITTFEYRPAPGIKISKIVNLTDDLALALSALSIRINAPIPGKDVVGVEIPNDRREMVVLRDLIASDVFLNSTSKMTLGLGRDILGAPVAAKMDFMPHLLMAGATGTGKSVGLNAMIISLLYKATPDEVKFIMVDPKRIELSVYDGIPHLISPVVTDMKKATNALFWAVREMERRYELLAEAGVRNILQFNDYVEKNRNRPHAQEGDDEARPLEKLPYIVVIVDEFADLMMVASRDVESALIRLAQMARAAGIHLILATQRPSVDVLTGIIKANFPTRISFQVSSRIDSRTILDSNGAERLLGNGDMLFLPPGTGRLQRLQGAYISEAEIARVTRYLKEQQAPDYVEDVTQGGGDDSSAVDESEFDEKYDEAVALVTRLRKASISNVQRHLRIGYNRAARIIEMMESQGVIGPGDGAKPREVLVKSYDD